jgi:hypothetical protein
VSRLTWCCASHLHLRIAVVGRAQGLLMFLFVVAAKKMEIYVLFVLEERDENRKTN